MGLFLQPRGTHFQSGQGAYKSNWGVEASPGYFLGEIWITYFNLDSSGGPSPRLVGPIAPPLSLPQALSRLNFRSDRHRVIAKKWFPLITSSQQNNKGD
jgi:hypothetical protein